ncbi:hypothetical protein [Catellatospora sp. NPDC049609]|uniref:hypothetical protein n=1 Tax=Catellatospora sp. NPDC049609 TaxID=3155505 RepID=UPI00341F0F64
MQIHREDLVEVTWMWDRAGFRRVAWQERSSYNRFYGIVVTVSLTVAAWMFHLWAQDGGTFPFGAVWITAIALALTARVALTGWAWLKITPDLWYTRLTVRIDASGVRLTSAGSEHFYRWSALGPVVRHEDWIFNAAGMGMVRVPRNAISPADDAAIAVVVDRYAHLVGRPEDMPPPAGV